MCVYLHISFLYRQWFQSSHSVSLSLWQNCPPTYSLSIVSRNCFLFEKRAFHPSWICWGNWSLILKLVPFSSFCCFFSLCLYCSNLAILVLDVYDPFSLNHGSGHWTSMNHKTASALPLKSAYGVPCLEIMSLKLCYIGYVYESTLYRVLLAWWRFLCLKLCSAGFYRSHECQEP